MVTNIWLVLVLGLLHPERGPWSGLSSLKHVDATCIVHGHGHQYSVLFGKRFCALLFSCFVYPLSNEEGFDQAYHSILVQIIVIWKLVPIANLFLLFCLLTLLHKSYHKCCIIRSFLCVFLVFATIFQNLICIQSNQTEVKWISLVFVHMYLQRQTQDISLGGATIYIKF